MEPIPNGVNNSSVSPAGNQMKIYSSEGLAEKMDEEYYSLCSRIRDAQDVLNEVLEEMKGFKQAIKGTDFYHPAFGSVSIKWADVRYMPDGSPVTIEQGSDDEVEWDSICEYADKLSLQHEPMHWDCASFLQQYRDRLDEIQDAEREAQCGDRE